MIISSEITVIIKGLVIGKKEDKYEDRYTFRSIESVRKYLPNSRIILSTWEGSDVSGLEVDEVIFNKDPGRLEMISYDGKLVSHISTNNQILTSLSGLKKTKTKYSLIIRSDTLLTGNRFLKYFLKYNKSECEGYLNKKIVVLSTYNPARVYKYKDFFNSLDWKVFCKNFFNLPDWVYFGETEDLKNIFSIPLFDSSKFEGEMVGGHYSVIDNLSPEQYVWVSFLRKYEDIKILPISSINYFSKEINEKSEESYAKNTIMLPADKFAINCLKYPRSAYGAKPWLSRGFYTMTEYNKIYNKYNKDNIFYTKNYLEEALYNIQLWTRFFARKHGGKLFKFFVNLIRRFNGNRDILK